MRLHLETPLHRSEWLNLNMVMRAVGLVFFFKYQEIIQLQKEKILMTNEPDQKQRNRVGSQIGREKVQERKIEAAGWLSTTQVKGGVPTTSGCSWRWLVVSARGHFPMNPRGRGNHPENDEEEI